MSEAPHRACRLTLKMEADTPSELADALRQMARQVERDELTTGVSGGPSSGSIYEFTLDPAQTHDAYFAQVREWLAAKA